MTCLTQPQIQLVIVQDSTKTAAEFLPSQPRLLPAVLGYNTVPGYHQLALLHTGAVLNTSDSFASSTGGNPLGLTVAYGGGNTAKVRRSSHQALSSLSTAASALLNMFEPVWHILILAHACNDFNDPSARGQCMHLLLH